MILAMGTPELSILTVVLLAFAILGSVLASIVIYNLMRPWLGSNPALLSSLVARAARGFRVLDVVLVMAAIVVMAVALGLYVHFGFGLPGAISSNSMDAHLDFDIFWHSAEALWDGRDIYPDTGSPGRSMNPPFWTVLTAPLALLEPIVAYRLFVLITLLMSVGYLAWMANELRLRAGWAVVGVVMLLLSAPLLGTLAQGQVYPLLGLGLVAAWVADRRGRPLVSGIALGLVVAIKPSLAPVLLWPLVRRRWGMLGAALASGAVATLLGIIVAGPGATLDWLKLVANARLDGYWDNASLPAAASRLFRENEFVEPIATLPWTITAAQVLGLGLIIFTAVKVRHDPEMGIWALVAASLLASPITWHNYLVLLGPGILLLLTRGQVALALLLIAMQALPPDYSVPWRYGNTIAAALMLTLYLYILVAHWLAFLLPVKKVPEASPEPAFEAGKSKPG
jgi:alpha-1,2-mannosyltransferase